MAAIVRLKRYISDEPLENIVVSCKRSRLSENVDTPENETVTTKLKFAGTVVDKADGISQHIRKAIKKEKLEKEYKRHAYRDPTARSRSTCQASSKNKRYLVVSQCRSQELDNIDCVDDGDGDSLQKPADASKESETDSASDKLYCLYDIEQDVDPITADAQRKDVVTCNSVPMKCEKATVDNTTNREYVYDLYYTNHYGFDYRWLESSSCIELYEENQVFMHDRQSDSDDDCCEEDSDSNEESNWRNDYPDEDPRIYDHKPGSSDDDDDHGGYENFGLGSDNDELENKLARRIEKCFLDDEDEEEDEREYYKHLGNDACSVEKEPDVGIRSYEQYKKDILKELNNNAMQ